MPDGSVRAQNGFHVTWRSSLRRDAVWPSENIPRPAIWPGRSQIVTGFTSYAELPRLYPEGGLTSKPRWQSAEVAGMSATLGPMSMSQTQGDTKKDGNRSRYSRRKREPSGEKEQRLKSLGQSQSEPALQPASGDESPDSNATLPALASPKSNGEKTAQGRGRRGLNIRRESAEQFDKVHLPVLMSRGYAAEAQKLRKRRLERTISSERLEQSPSSLRNRKESSPDRKNSLEASSPKRKVLQTQLHHTALQESPFPRSPSEIAISKSSANPRNKSPFDHKKGSLALREISSIATQISEDLEDTRKSLQERRWLTATLTKSSNDAAVVTNHEAKSPDTIPLSGSSLLLPEVTRKTASPPGSSHSQLMQVPDVLPSCGIFSANPTKARSRSPSPAMNKSGRLNLPIRGLSGGSDKQIGSARRSPASTDLPASPRPLPFAQPPGGKSRAASGGSIRRTPASARRTPASASSTGGTNEEGPDTAVLAVNAPADSTGDVPISAEVDNESEQRNPKDDFMAGLNEDGIVRMRGAFFRFTEPYSADLCIDNLAELLKYLGHQVTNATAQGVMELVKGITPYEYLNFDEFLAFMEKYIRFEEEQFRMEFEKADDDNSGELSVSELREVMKSLGIPPLNAMVREAVKYVDKDSNCQLNFDEFMQFLNVYRRFEGFTSTEVSDLLKAYNRFAGDGPFWSNLLVPALTQFYGRHVTDKAKSLEKELSERMKLEGRVDTSLTFEDLLILARRVRESYYAGVYERRNPVIVESENQKRWREFVKADKDKNHSIGHKELKKVLRDQGYEPLSQVLNEIYEEVLDEGWKPDLELDFDQFFDFLLVYRRREGFLKVQVEDMMSVYKHYDEDGSESIGSLELDNIFRHLGYTLNMDDIHHYLHIVDDDQSNELDFREFLHLMQLHRCTEVQEMRETFKKYCVDEALQNNIGKVRELPKLAVVGALADCKYKELPEGLEIPEKTNFDCFVSLADKCRSTFVASQRRKAGYCDTELKLLRESFDNFDSDNSGTIDHSELAKVLESFGWKPKTRQERDALLGRLEKARVLAKEAGVKHVTPAGSAEVSFWEFIQLKRMIQRHEDTAHEEHMKTLMKELSFTATEVEEFREIFRGWVEAGDGDDEEEDAENAGGGWHEKGNLSRRAVRQQVRSLCGKIPGDRRRGLEKQLNDLDDDNIGLDFEKFLRLMRWMLDSHFMDDVFKKADKKADDLFKS